MDLAELKTRLASTPLPLADEPLELYLERAGSIGQGFSVREYLRPNSPRHERPPRRWWPNFARSTWLAQALRDDWTKEGGKGLLVAAAYRPKGGEARSMHKVAAAVDLDLLRDDRHRAADYALCAARLWRRLHPLPVGIGTYAPDGVLRTSRVHLDFGLRFRAWQGIGQTVEGRTWARVPAALVLAPAASRRIVYAEVADASGPDADPEP